MWYLEYTTNEQEEVDWVDLDNGDEYFFIIDDDEDEIDFEDY